MLIERGDVRAGGYRSRATRGLLCAVALASVAVWANATPTSAQSSARQGPTVGLALSGGSAKGFAHVGVIRELERAGVRVDVVAGTSMGSVIGGLYAIGMPIDSIEMLIARTDWPTVLGDGAERERRFLHQRRFDERAVLTMPIVGGIASLPTGAISGSNIIRLAEVSTWRAATIRDFADLPRPFVAVSADIETGAGVPLTGGVLSEAMRASSGIPGAVEPFDLDGRLLVDGAVARNLPAIDARRLGADIVICSDVSDPLVTNEELSTFVDVLDQVMTLAQRRSVLEQREECDVLVRPDVTGLSGLAFERHAEWIRRGEAAARPLVARFSTIAAEQGVTRVRPPPARFLGDSVRVVGVEIEGATREQTASFVRHELRMEEGAYLSPDQLASRLSDIDATGLFGMVRYRLDEAEGGVVLTVNVQERPKDRLGIGIRYDDDRRAALLFTMTLHSLVRFGSVTRLDLRVGEETRARIAYLRRHGVTGRFEGGTSASWSQGVIRMPVSVPGAVRRVAGFELTEFSSFLGVVGGRSTLLGFEVTGEWATADFASVPDVLSLTGAALFDHESLDRIDFPNSGADAAVRWEAGGSDVTAGEGFWVFSSSVRFYVPLHARLAADFGGFLGVARGPDLPIHRTFFVGGAHPSAIFSRTQPLFHGLAPEALTGTSAQIARAGLRWEVRDRLHLRAGVDVGGALDDWLFPMDDAVVGWALTLGVQSLAGPIALEWSDASTASGSRLSVSVGRLF